MMRKIFTIFAGLATLVPLIALAQVSPEFSRQGIFGCGRNAAALSTSVGAFSATGGVYVPVADYTVELNTGTLVYLECVLRGIVNRESESASVAIINQEVRFFLTGDEGGPLFRTNPEKQLDTEANRVTLVSLQRLQQIDDPVTRATGGTIVQAAARNYMASRQDTAGMICPYDVDLNACRNGDLSPACKDAFTDPRCSDEFRFWYAREYVLDRAAAALEVMEDCWEEGDGFSCVTTIDENGDRIIQTPSSIVEAKAIQALTSGFRRVESANNIDQMVGALYAGLGTQALTGSGGLLTGLSTAIGGSASYLSRMTAESNQGLRNAAANAALQILAAARNVEVQYNQVVSAIANSLTNAIGQLRSAEKQCWDLIIYNTLPSPAGHVCAAPPVDGKCTGVSGAQLTIATSTDASKAIIDAQIAPIATQAVQNVQKSQAALTLIDQLIQGVSGTASLDAQRLALVQLDQLVSQGRLHVQADVNSVQQQQAAVADAMSQLITQTKTLWADDTDPTKGWCNVNNPAVITFWDSRWR
jgi:hypothetical protein